MPGSLSGRRYCSKCGWLDQGEDHDYEKHPATRDGGMDD